MASIGHVAVGLAAARLLHQAAPPPRAASPSLLPSLLALSALSLLPDLDVIAFSLNIEYGAEWGHRGAAHSLLLGLCVGAPLGLLLGRRVGARALGVVLGALVLMSHGLLDALTTGGKGVADAFSAVGLGRRKALEQGEIDGGIVTNPAQGGLHIDPRKVGETIGGGLSGVGRNWRERR